MSGWFSSVSLPLLAAGVVSLAGCGSDPEPEQPAAQDTAALEEASYVGEVAGTDMRVGIAAHNGKADVFFCGGPTSLARTKWFRALAFPLEQPFAKDGFSTTVVRGDDQATGTLVFPDGTSHAWSATKVDGNGLAGLYDVKDERGVGGVIVHSQSMTQGAFIAKDVGVEVRQIIVVRPVDRGLSITVDDRALVATRVRPTF